MRWKFIFIKLADQGNVHYDMEKQTMKTQNYKWPEYTVGVCYYPEQWNESLWESDLDRMLKAGISVVRIAEFAWTVTEPEEGIFRFDFFDRFLDLCLEKGMKVIFGTPTATPPAWLTKKYPEVLNADSNGIPYEHGARRHYNYNSPVYLEKTRIIVTVLAEHYGKHPAICGWQIDNELNCETCDFHSESDQNAFRVFLQKKYQDLEALNRAWGSVFWNQTYTDWEQIRLPGHVLNKGWNPHQRLDYIRFVSESVRSFCYMQAQILRKHIRPEAFITTNGLFWHIDNKAMQEESLDIFGYDSYPNFAFGLDHEKELRKNGFGLEERLHDRRWGMHLSEVRAVCPHFCILEQQAGAGSWISRMEGPMPIPGQITLWAMQSISHGADFVSFFRWRTCTVGTEMYWHGILDYDNRDNRRLAEVADFASILKKISPLCGSDYLAPLAVVKDFDNMADAEIDVWHGRLDYPDEENIYRQAQLSHVPCDYVFLSDHTDAKDLDRYQVLIYPHPAIMTVERAKIVKDYVERGGTLILGCRSGYKESNGQCLMEPAPGFLSALTGTTVKESGFQHLAMPDAFITLDGEKIEAAVFQDHLEPRHDTEVMACYEGAWFAGTAALTKHPVGSGFCIHWGSTFTPPVLKKLFDMTGLSGRFDDLVSLPECVEIVERVKDERRFIILLNYMPDAEEITLHKPMKDIVNGTSLCGKMILHPFEFLVLEKES